MRAKSGLRLVFLVAIGLLAGALQQAWAEGTLLPVPRLTIYPRDIIRESMLQERQVDFLPQSANIIADRQALIGKAARQTLLPGAPIPASAVEEPRLVDIGRTVKLVFSEGGITIITSGQSLQTGMLGDQVRARNLDSGATVTGTVQADGSLRVGQE